MINLFSKLLLPSSLYSLWFQPHGWCQVAPDNFLKRKLSGLCFFFLSLHRVLPPPQGGSVLLWGCMDKWLFQPVRSTFVKTATRTRWRSSAVSEQRSNLATPVQQRPLSWRRPSSSTELPGADAGADQWYKTIAKLMQGRNIKLHNKNCEPRVAPVVTNRRCC